MADHGHVEYATAEGNDLPAHEETYERFVHLAVVGSAYVANIVIGLAIGAVAGSWLVAFAIMVIATVIAIHRLRVRCAGAEHGDGGDLADRTRTHLRRLTQGFRLIAGHEEAGECALP